MSGPRIAAFVLQTPDPEGLAGFYGAAFDAVGDGRGVRVGGQVVRFAAMRGGAARSAAVNATSFQHFAIVVSDMRAAMARLGAVPGWQPISRDGPRLLPERSGGVTAFKFRDPDGHPLELLEFPADRVPAVWRGAAGLFLGIDHSAITVMETARSVAFWRGLGFERVGGSVNSGPEQAALDGLDAPVVEVTALEAGDAGPHLELLCYRTPPVFADARDAEDALATAIVLGGGERVSAVDPDGHRVFAGLVG